MRISLPGKIFAGFVALLVTFGGVMGYTVWEVRSLGQELTRFHENLVPLPSIVAEIRSDLRRTSMVLDLPDANVRRRAVHLLRRVEKTPESIEADFELIGIRLHDAGDTLNSDQLLLHFKAVDRERRAVMNELETYFDEVEADTARPERPYGVRDSLSHFSREMKLFGLQVDRQLNLALEAFARDEQRVAWGAIILVGVAMLIGLGITFSANRMLRPLGALRAGVERIAQGEYGRPVTISGDGELGALAAEFNRMAEAIHRRDKQLQDQQQELLHRERLATVGHMSAQITHELRNPLNSIGLNSELLLEGLEESGEEHPLHSTQNLLRNIVLEVARLREITEEYLQFARLPIPELRPTDLNVVAHELIEFVRTEMTQSEIKIRLDPDPAGRPALVDANQIRAALLNLVRNAREALSEGGHIVLRVRSMGDGANVEVTDNGAGIPPDVRDRMFEPFFSTKPHGTGLGLAMVQKIIEAQNGSVHIETPTGSGTTVRLRLPLYVDGELTSEA